MTGLHESSVYTSVKRVDKGTIYTGDRHKSQKGTHSLRLHEIKKTKHCSVLNDSKNGSHRLSLYANLPVSTEKVTSLGVGRSRVITF